MKISITSAADWRSRVSRLSHHYIDGAGYFLPRSYGAEVLSIGILFMCADPDLDFKRRVRFSPKKKEFYTDIMLDLPTIMPLSMKEKMSYVSRELHDQLSEQLNKRKFKDFDHIRFLADLREWLNGIEERYDGHTTGAWHY